MDTTSGEEYRGEFRRHFRSGDFEVIRSIGEMMRSEFGDSIDAHPGGTGSEAGAINRAFRMAAWVILGDDSPGDATSARLTWTLRRMALDRLDGLGVSGPQAESMLAMEPCLATAGSPT